MVADVLFPGREVECGRLLEWEVVLLEAEVGREGRVPADVAGVELGTRFLLSGHPGFQAW